MPSRIQSEEFKGSRTCRNSIRKRPLRLHGTPDNEVGNGWGYYDLGLHDENLILRARELGLDTLIMGIRDEKAIREALSIPENELLGAVIAVGYRAINPDKPKRKTVDDILKLF